MLKTAGWLTGVTLALVLTMVGGGAPVAAAPTDAIAKAKHHFERGETLYRQGEFRKALVEYKQALQYKKYPAFYFNIAQCHRQLDNYKMALFSYRLYLSEKPNAPNKSEVNRRIREMEKKLAAQKHAARQVGRISVTTRPRGAKIYLDKMDGAASGTSPAILPKVAAGEHLLVVRLKGYREVTRKVDVKAGQLALVQVDLQPLVDPRRVDPRRVDPRRVDPRRVDPRPVVPNPVDPGPVRMTAPFYKRWWFWTGVVATVGLALGSTYTGLAALEKKDEYDREDTPPSSLDQLEKDAKRFANICDALWVSSAVVGIATIIGAAVVGKGSPEKSGRVSRTLFTPSCSRTGCSLVVQGRF